MEKLRGFGPDMGREDSSDSSQTDKSVLIQTRSDPLLFVLLIRGNRVNILIKNSPVAVFSHALGWKHLTEDDDVCRN